MSNSILNAYVTTTINSTMSCIKCVFYDEASQGCVVVIHPKASMLSISSHIGLINIETEYFNRSGDQAEGCIDRKSLGNNVVVVFLYNKVILGPPVFIRMTQHEGQYYTLSIDSILTSTYYSINLLGNSTDRRLWIIILLLLLPGIIAIML